MLNIQDEKMEVQREMLDTEIEKWKSRTEQIDDILVIGLKL